MSESNTLVLKQKIETIKPKNIDLYDILKRLNSNVEETYNAIFEGPLPANSAKNLDFSEADLSSVPTNNLPSTIAYTDLENQFIQNQKIVKDDGIIEFQTSTGTAKTRIHEPTDGGIFVGAGIDYNGGAFTSDGVGTPCSFTMNVGILFNILGYVAGVLQTLLRIENAGYVTIGALASQVDLLINELGLKNNKFIRGTNAASTHNWPMIGIDANDLVELGSNQAAGAGNISIPRDDNANLPAAGATRNGILILDKTNNRLCYYVSGNRYFIPIGTLF